MVITKRYLARGYLVGYFLLMILWIALIVLALGGCTTTGRARAAVAREAQVPHFHTQAQVLEPMIAFEAAVDQQLGAGGIDAETFALIKRWIGASLGVLNGPHPDDWQAVAREGWAQVRSAIGPYDRLTPFGRLIDKLIE